MLPKELSTFDACFEVPIEKFTYGIYFLYLDEKLVYIGQSADMFGRVSTHLKSKKNSFNKCYFFPCDKENLSLFESALITYLSPPLNKGIISNRYSITKTNEAICKLLKMPITFVNSNAEISDEKLVGSKEASTILKVSLKTLRQLTALGDIKNYKKKLEPGKSKTLEGKGKYKIHELQAAKIFLSSLPLPLKAEE